MFKSWCTSAAALGALLVALPTPTGGVRTANEVVHFAISHQDCTSICSDDAVCEVDGKSKFTEQVSTRAVCPYVAAPCACLPSHCALYVLRLYTTPRALWHAPCILGTDSALSLCTHTGDSRQCREVGPSRNQALCLVLSRRVARAAQGRWREVSAVF